MCNYCLSLQLSFDHPITLRGVVIQGCESRASGVTGFQMSYSTVEKSNVEKDFKWIHSHDYNEPQVEITSLHTFSMF